MITSSIFCVLPNSILVVATTDSFAIKPEISEVTTRQSPKPSGRNSGAIQLPMIARMLSDARLSGSSVRDGLKLLRNQITIVAIKMIVNARCRKSFVLSHSSIPTFFADGIR